MVETPSTSAAHRVREPGWGSADVLFWFVVAQIGSVFWVVGLRSIWGDLGGGSPEESVGFLLAGTVVLWFAYGVGPVITTRLKGNGARADLGAWLRADDVPLGLIIGVLTQVPVVWALYFPILRFVDVDPGAAARQLAERVDGPADTVLLVVMAGIMAPVVEEIFFRGFVLRLLLRRSSPVVSVVLQALLFAAVHFQPIQFPGLFVMGLISGTLAVRFGRLGPSWAMHVGFNGLTLITLLSDFL